MGHDAVCNEEDTPEIPISAWNFPLHVVQSHQNLEGMWYVGAA